MAVGAMPQLGADSRKKSKRKVMKAEHRHELHQNELAHRLTRALEWGRVNAPLLVGIVVGAAAGVTGEIANSGKIIIDETYTPVDIDKDGDLDGPFAQGARRTGIRTSGAFTGNIRSLPSIMWKTSRPSRP